MVRLAHSADLRSRLCHVSSAPSVAYSKGCSWVVTHPGTNPARRCLTSVIWREPVCHRCLAVDYTKRSAITCHRNFNAPKICKITVSCANVAISSIRNISKNWTDVVEIERLRQRETHTQQVSDEWTYFPELVFFPFSSDVYRGQKEQTKNNDYIHNGAWRQDYR